MGAAGRAAQSSSKTLKHELEHDGRWHEIAPFVRGGYWRNFKVKYPETNEMYARMQMVSRRLHEHEPHRTASDAERSLSDSRSSTRPARSSTAASATAATGTARSAARICRTCATRSSSI